MNVNITDTLSVPELAWALMGIAGSLWCYWGLTILYADRRRLRNDGKNGADDIVIATHIGTHYFLLAIHMAVAFTGIIAGTIAPYNRDTPLTWTAIIITLGIASVEVSNVCVSLWIRARRTKLQNYIIARNDRLMREAIEAGNMPAEPPPNFIRG